jgi:hypothetical protein
MNSSFLFWALLTILLHAVLLFVGWNYVVAPLCHWGHMLPWQAGLAALCLWLWGVGFPPKLTQ